MPETAISIRPGVGMLNLFPHMKYQPWYALGELVDNSIQSFRANRDALRDIEGPDYRLRVEIVIDKTDAGSIVVRDNAAGIVGPDWPRAFRVAEPPADNSGLSQFGVGMKAACCWFAKEWTVRSSALGEPSARTVKFDVPAIVEAKEESLAVVEEVEDVTAHFTEVRMEKLYRVPQKRTLFKIREYLGGIYREFLRNGDVEITLNGDLVSYVEPPVLDVPRFDTPDGEQHQWRQEVDIRLDSGRRITGFVAIREKGSTASAGLALFYRGKVVMGAGEESYRPNQVFGASNDFRYQRVFGELHMDDFSVTYTKDDLVWYDEEEEFLDLLRKKLDEDPWPLLKQARRYRSTTPPPDTRKVAEEVLDEIVRSFDEVADFGYERRTETEYVERTREGTSDVDVTDEVDAQPDDKVTVDRTLLLPVGGVEWKVAIRLINDLANSKWLTVTEGGGVSHEVRLDVNQAHPFMRTYCDLPSEGLEPVWRIAVALGLGQALARASGAKMPGLVTDRVNDILRDHLAAKA